MANWLLAIDDDRARRETCVTRARAAIEPMPGLQVGACGSTWWDVVWAAGRAAPIDAVSGAGGGVLFGDALDDEGRRQTIASVREAWRDGAPAQWDGYYAAVLIDEHRHTATIGTDVLGVFPVYWWTNGAGVTLAGTSPELFRAHPGFQPSLDEEGLVGILMTNGLVGGKTIWGGVRRLGAGQRLSAAGPRVREVEGYRVTMGLDAVDLPLAGHVRQVASALDDAVRRHAPPDGPCGLLLSGGLDSRLLAGCLHGQGRDVRALTFGRPDDIEMVSARAVAAELGFAHQTADVADGEYPAAADRLAKWEMLAAGFSGVPEWAMQKAIAGLPDRVVLGHLLDAVAGGSHVAWAYDASTGTMGFDYLLPRVTAWGFPPDILDGLLVPSCRPLVRDVIDGLRRKYEGGAEREHHRAWSFDLEHRQRFHVGSALWVTSFSSWPVVPALDRRVLRVAAALPGSSLADRRAQTEVLVSSFPRLAGLPLDRNSYDNRPLSPRLRHHLSQFLADRRRGVSARLRQWSGRPARERRYYRRLYDLDGPGWRAVRRHAEPCRNHLPSMISREAVQAAWPAPEAQIGLDDPIRDASRTKMLLGLALWSRHPQTDSREQDA